MSFEPPMTGDRAFRDDVVRVASLTVTSPLISGLTFSNCQIIGPAVLALMGGVEISHCVFEGDVNSIFWEVPHSRPLVFGAVGVRDVVFSRCTFQAVGFAGPPELREMFQAALNQTP